MRWNKIVASLLLAAAMQLTPISHVHAQQRTQDFAEKFVSHSDKAKELSAITLTPKMIEAFVEQQGDDNEKLCSLLTEAHGLRILMSQSEGATYMTEARHMIESYPERFVHYTDLANGTKMYVRRKEAKVVEVILMLQNDEDPFVLMDVTGTFDEKEIKQFAESQKVK